MRISGIEETWNKAANQILQSLADPQLDSIEVDLPPHRVFHSQNLKLIAANILSRDLLSQ